jgi:hypothetical protein
LKPGPVGKQEWLISGRSRARLALAAGDETNATEQAMSLNQARHPPNPQSLGEASRNGALPSEREIKLDKSLSSLGPRPVDRSVHRQQRSGRPREGLIQPGMEYGYHRCMPYLVSPFADPPAA